VSQSLAVAALSRDRDDCWTRVGVRGDRSCPELKVHVHCRNCPVYSAAAGELLDAELPSGYTSGWTSHLSASRELDERRSHSVLMFRLGGEWFGLPTQVVQEVANLRAIHSLPHRNAGMILGLTNVRGELLVCVSLDRVLGVARSADSSPHGSMVDGRRLLVIVRDGVRVVFPVDEVHDVHRFHPRELSDVPATVSKAAAAYSKAVLSWRQKTVGVLDDQLLFQALQRSLA
jgi:chemotaxis-related protein WspD